MEDITATIRGLINDLTRTLTASVVHLDDLLMRLDRDLKEYGDAYLADQQLGRALKFFFEMRSLYIMWIENHVYHNIRINDKDNKVNMMHLINNVLTVIYGCCDLLIVDVSYQSKDKIDMISFLSG